MDDRDEQELQSMGVLAIYVESYRLIFKFRKIFTQITLTLILPLCFIFLSHKQVSGILHRRISHAEYDRHHAPKPTTLSDVVSSHQSIFILIKGAYFTFLLVFSLLATSAVVYTVACIYTSRSILAFNDVVKTVVPRVWKRLMVTFLCAFLLFCTYNLVFLTVLYSVFLFFTTFSDNYVLGQAIVYLVLGLYLLGFVYMSIIWQVASVVTVLEESYGFGAMIKSKGLIKGRITVGLIIFFKQNLSLAVIDCFFTEFVVEGCGVLKRIGIGAVCLVVLMKVILLALVVQTVVYFVCKASSHDDSVDKSGLSARLEGDLGEGYVPLKAKAVAMEEYRV